MKYLYKINNEPPIYYKNIKTLIKMFFRFCNINYIKSGLAKKEFYKNIKNDGYLIHQFLPDGDIRFFIEINKIDNTINDIKKYEVLKELENNIDINKKRILKILNKIKKEIEEYGSR